MPNLTSDQFESVLKQSADNIGGGPLPNPSFGWGRVNAAKAISSARQYMLSDATPPTVAITNPLNDARVSGKIIIKVEASDNLGLKQVQIKIDGKTMATSNASPLSYSWNIRYIAAGTHTITGSATDTAGLACQSSITVKK